MFDLLFCLGNSLDLVSCTKLALNLHLTLQNIPLIRSFYDYLLCHDLQKHLKLVKLKWEFKLNESKTYQTMSLIWYQVHGLSLQQCNDQVHGLSLQQCNDFLHVLKNANIWHIRKYPTITAGKIIQDICGLFDFRAQIQSYLKCSRLLK